MKKQKEQKPLDCVSSLLPCQLVLLPFHLTQLHLLHTHRLLGQRHQGAPVHLATLGSSQRDALHQGLEVPARIIINR